VETGATLAFAECRAIAIDPLFQFRGDPFGRRRETYLFQMTSDEFFERHDLRTFFPDGLDFAFLDGMHHFEFLLRDFLNTEKFSHRDTIVGLHDCYPINTEMANRETNYDRRADMATRRMWTGDVWKLLPILRDFRPDLEVIALDCPPTGLIIVRGLNPASKVLVESYDEIVAKYKDINLESFGLQRFRQEFSSVDSRSVFQPDALTTFFRRQG
jgi:hypothetical protein